jgi:hypothetical protein
MPPRTLSPWCPPEGALEKAKKVWEDTDYLGLGWSKKDVDESYAKISI